VGALPDGKGDELPAGDPLGQGEGEGEPCRGARDGAPLAQGLYAMPQNGPWKRPAELPPAFEAHAFANGCQSGKCATSL